MITETQYQILMKCKDVAQPFDKSLESEFAYLSTNQYLVTEDARIGNELRHYYRTGKIKGLLAIQEYEDRQNSIQKENRSLQIAEDSNRIAEEANQIAREANTKSKKANAISIWAIGISAILSALTIVASVLIAVFVKS